MKQMQCNALNIKKKQQLQNKFGCTSFAELHGQKNESLLKSPLKSSHTKNTCQIFLKIPELKISNPK